MLVAPEFHRPVDHAVALWNYTEELKTATDPDRIAGIELAIKAHLALNPSPPRSFAAELEAAKRITEMAEGESAEVPE